MGLSPTPPVRKMSIETELFFDDGFPLSVMAHHNVKSIYVLPTLPVSDKKSISTFKTNARIFFFLSHALRQEFLAFNLVLQEEKENFFFQSLASR